jgi:hypothetical protein
MGGGSSTLNKTSTSTKNIVESLSKSIQNCSGHTIINNEVKIIGNFNVVRGVRLVQGMKLSNSCAMSETNIAETQQTVANAIKQAAESQGDAIFGGLSKTKSQVLSEIENETRTVINRESIQNIVNNFNLTQEFFLNGNNNIVEDITMEQSMEVLYDNCLATLNKMKSFQEVTNQVDQKTKTTQTNFISDVVKSITGLLGTLGGLMTIVFIVVIIVIAYLLKSQPQLVYKLLYYSTGGFINISDKSDEGNEGNNSDNNNDDNNDNSNVKYYQNLEKELETNYNELKNETNKETKEQKIEQFKSDLSELRSRLSDSPDTLQDLVSPLIQKYEIKITELESDLKS